MQDNVIKRKTEIISFLKKHKERLSYLGLVLLILVGFWIRTRNLFLLTDETTGKFIPVDPDASLFLRYAKYVLENGQLMINDLMRYYPIGYSNLDEFNFLSHFIVYFYKFLHFFNSNITIEYADVIFPPITFGIALIFFYLLVRRLFDFRVAFLASAFLAFMPSFLFRTNSGVGDKEALGIVFFFAALYFYVLAVKSKHKYGFTYGLVSGIFTAILGSIWGGVNFIFLILGLTTLTRAMLQNINKREFYSYICWWLTTFLLLNIFYPKYYSFKSIIISFTSQITLIALVAGLVHLIINKLNNLNLKERLKADKYPIVIISTILFGLFGLLFFPFYFAIFWYKGGLEFYLTFFYTEFIGLFSFILKPFSQDIWSITIAENVPVYLTDLVKNFGLIFLITLFISSIFLFYNMFKDLKKRKFIFTFYYSLFLIAFFFSKYSQSSSLDGISNYSGFIFYASIIIFGMIFLGYFLFSFYINKKEFKIAITKEDEEYNKELEKDKDLFKVFKEIPFDNLFLLFWFLIIAFAARNAFRILFIFVPIVSILVSFFLIYIYDFYSQTNDKLLKFFSFSLLILLIFMPFVQGSLVNDAIKIIEKAKSVNSIFDPQWQNTMKFVRENTPTESVFSNWWDYGYLIQTFGERATLSDGGNARGGINYYIGRYLLTGKNRAEALGLLRTHNATHLLITSEEIGKYLSFSSIASDENMDRRSHIPIFVLNPEIKKETYPNKTVVFSYLYKGAFYLEEDLIFNGKFFPTGKAVILGSIVSFRDSGGEISIKQPIIVVSYNGVMEEIPLNCLYFQNTEYVFSNNGLNSYGGCLRIIPSVNENTEVNNLGASLFLSQKVRNSFFTQLYLFDKDEATSEEFKGFNKIYDGTQQGFGLIYDERFKKVWGPIKIWGLSYDSSIKINSSLLN